MKVFRVLILVGTTAALAHMLYGIVTFSIPTGLSPIGFSFGPEGWVQPLDTGPLLTMILTFITVATFGVSLVLKNQKCLAISGTALCISCIPSFVSLLFFNYVVPPILVASIFFLFEKQTQSKEIAKRVVAIIWVAYVMTLPVYMISI